MATGHTDLCRGVQELDLQPAGQRVRFAVRIGVPKTLASFNITTPYVRRFSADFTADSVLISGSSGVSPYWPF